MFGSTQLLHKSDLEREKERERERMTYTGLELFMENLSHLIYCNNNPLINNHPSILSKRPQIQLLYEELGSLIQPLFVDQEHDLHELEKVRNLQKRFKDAAEEAQDIIDLFVSVVNFRKQRHLTWWNSLQMKIKLRSSLNLKDVMKSIKSIKVEFTMIKDNMKMDSSRRTYDLKMQSSATAAAAAGTSCTRNPIGKKKVLEEVVVGLDRHAALIRDKLVEDQKQLDFVSIVGMGGLGKTTLATKVFHDRFVVYHFHIRVWVTVSQTYEKRDLLIEILASIGIKLDPVGDTDSRLRGMLHKSLMGKRYLIVIDDIWSIEAWDDLKLFFPNDNTGSRILLTSRLKEVASHVKLNGFIYSLPYLTEEESWELLKKKVFQGDECPKWLIGPGMQIARNCHGLPLAVVVIAGILAKEAVSKDSWERIAQSVSSYIVSDCNGLETLALSYDHLPRHLRDCFLYLGGFPEDYKFRVRRLILLWMAEGFVQESGDRSLEEIAEDYLMDLVDRNLLIVAERRFDGGVKACVVHDLVRELCLEKATEERFYLKMDGPRKFIMPCKPRRVFTHDDLYIKNHSDPRTPSIRSILHFQLYTSFIHYTDKYFLSYALLMVLDLSEVVVANYSCFPEVVELLIHLRYLSIWCAGCVPSSICNLWSLQTLILRSSAHVLLPDTISNLVNLRHLLSRRDVIFHSVGKPMNLQTISKVVLGDDAESWLKCFPNIKKLACTLYSDEENDFESLTYLQTLKLIGSGTRRKSIEPEFPRGEPNFRKNSFRFPTTLKKLTLLRCHLPWSDMSIIQSLPNLEVLKLLDNAFVGPRWDTGAEQFQQLKFLKLRKLNIQQWETYRISFPCLKKLVLEDCKDLEEIPLEIGDISTLELMKNVNCSRSIRKSFAIIQKEQHAVGNYELEIQCWT